MASSNPDLERSESRKAQNEVNFIPDNALEQLSPTSNALECFAKQRFSRKLQLFLLNYSLYVNSDLSVPVE